MKTAISLSDDLYAQTRDTSGQPKRMTAAPRAPAAAAAAYAGVSLKGFIVSCLAFPAGIGL